MSHVKVEKLNFRKAEPVIERDLEPTEICCSFFGCGKKLTREEKLCGDRCVSHPKGKKVQKFFNCFGKY